MYSEEEQQYGMGRVDYERMGGSLGIGDSKDRFIAQLFAITSMIENLDSDTIRDIIEMARKLHRFEAKNPAAIILGYLSLKNGEIDKPQFNKVINTYLTKVPVNFNVTPPDVLRYARLIQKNL